MKKLLYFLFTCSVLFIQTSNSLAQETIKKWRIHGSPINSYTLKSILGGMQVDLLTTDSTVVSTTTTRDDGTWNGPGSDAMSYFSFYVDGKTSNYIIRLLHPDYQTTYYPVKLKFYKRQTSISLGEIKMRRLSREEKEVAMGEVVVKATKVKFYSKGDTLVYNADAFQLAEGSMLDALIGQLPGVELKDDGRILVNGKYVESLLLNGKDFFKGDNTILLDNLPSYMVKDVKVYNKESEESKLMGRKLEDGNFVMDVNLKRQYEIGWIANTEWGGGTAERYMGRLFALRFTPQSRVSVFANMNNLNDRRKPGNNGEWSPSDLSGGLTTSRIAGLDYMIDDKRIRYFISGNAKAEYSDNEHSTVRNSQNFLPGGDTYGRLWNESRNKNISLSTSHYFCFINSGKGHMKFMPSLNYQKYKNRSSYLSGTFSDDPSFYSNLLDSLKMPNSGALLRKMLINRNKENAKSDGHSLNGNMGVFGFHKIPFTNDGMSIFGNVSFNNSENNSFNHYLLDYPASATADTDFRNRHQRTPKSGYSYEIGSEYFYRATNRLQIIPYYQYSQSYNSQENSLFRLDQLDGWGESNTPTLGALPSVVEDLQQTLDKENSYNSRQYTFVHNVALRFQWTKQKFVDGNRYSKWYIELCPRIRIEERRLNYASEITPSIQSRKERLWNPTFKATRNTAGYKHEWELSANMNANMPSMMNLLDVTFTSNPLYIRKGNPNLKNSQTYHVALNYKSDKWLLGTGRMLSANTGFFIPRNEVAMGSVYNKTTGVRTTTPENVNGNWNTWINIDFTTPLDSDRKLMLNAHTRADYYNNVDLARVNDDLFTSRNTVRNRYLRETVKADYRLEKIKIGAKVAAVWINTSATREGFNTINALDLNYGLNGQIELPWSMQISTDLTMYTRRGYDDKVMNKDELVWNARISKRMLQGNLIFILDGFDVLGNLSNVQRSLNAQGRTESYYNVIPRYVMLHAIYRLNLKPKKR